MRLASLTTLVVCICAAASLRMTRAFRQRRVLSIGDLHGDFEQTSGILRNLGLMNEDGGWSGGGDVLIQTGDIADRGGQELQIYKAFFRLQDEAKANGGEVIMLLGNHELMNLQGDYSHSNATSIVNRTATFGPQGWLGKQLRQRTQMVARIGEKYGFPRAVLYAHAGILPEVAKPLDHRNNSLNAEDAGELGVHSLNVAVRRRLTNRTWTQIRDDNSSFFSETGPLWTRDLASSLGTDICLDLEQSLHVFGATRMVVGHTPQADGKVHHRCHGRLVLGDTMISSAYKQGGHPSAIEVFPTGEAIARYPISLSGHTHKLLPVVENLKEGIVADSVGGGLTPRLRWQLHVLGLDMNETLNTLPSPKEVRKAYHRLSMVHHPDKGGTREEFRDLQVAFEGVLGSLDAVV